MRFCTNCGNELAPEANFCAKCGTTVKKETQKDDYSNLELKKTQELKNENNKRRGGSTLRWVLLIIAVLVLDSIVVQWIVDVIGPHAIPIFLVSLFFLFIAGVLILKGIQLKKASIKQPAKIPFFIKVGFLGFLFAFIFLFFDAIEIKDLPKKYEQAMNALTSEEWDKAVQTFAAIKSVNPKYKDTVKRLEEAKSNRAKSVYESAKNLLSNAKSNLSKKQYSASIDSTKEAISLLKDAKEFNESANLLSEAEEFLGIARKKKQKSEELQKKKKQQQQARRAQNAWKNQDNSTMAYIMIEDFVKNRLKSPSTAKFPGVFDGRQDHVTYLGNQKYRIISYVDSQNSFGAMIRTRFVGEIEQTSNDRWRLISLEFLQ